MAQHYIQFSEGFKLTSAEEIDWWEKLVGQIANPNEEDIADCVKRFGFEPDEIGFEMCIAGLEERIICVSADEFGNVENAAIVLQEFFKTFDKDNVFYIRWAETCSRPIIGEFGGGAVVVTKDIMKWLSVSDWVTNTIAELKK